MSSVESFGCALDRNCCVRDCGGRGSGEARSLGVPPSGEERKRGRLKADEAVAFCLRLNDNLSR